MLRLLERKSLTLTVIFRVKEVAVLYRLGMGVGEEAGTWEQDHTAFELCSGPGC